MRKYGRKLVFIMKFWTFIPFLCRFYLSKEVKRSKKLLSALLIIGYILLPLDIIPDFITFFGLVDDVLIVTLIFSAMINMAPDSLKEQYRLNENRF